MKDKNKNNIKLILNSAYSFLLTVIFIFTILITFTAVIANKNKTQTSLCGYSVCKILSGSMANSGFDKDDFIVTKQVTRNDLKVGDIISFYVHKNTVVPILVGEDRSDMIIWFHEIVEIKSENGKILYKTKGSSNVLADNFWVPFEAVSGRYIKSSSFFTAIMKFVLSFKGFSSFIIGFGILLLIKACISLYKSIMNYIYLRKVINGQVDLLSKNMIIKNIYKEFTFKEKLILLYSSPKTLRLIYDYLLFNKLENSKNIELINKLKNKRCLLYDSIYLTYINEGNEAGITIDEYIKSLPEYKRGYSIYNNIANFQESIKTEKLNIWTIFAGCTFVSFIFLLFSNFYSLYSIALILVSLSIFGFALNITINNKNKKKEISVYLDNSKQLPDRYNFLINPKKYTEEQIEEFIRQISKLNVIKEKKVEEKSKSKKNTKVKKETNKIISQNDIAGKQISIKYNKSFLAKLIQSSDDTKRYFSEIKNKLLSYKNVKDRISWNYNNFNKGWQKLARINISGEFLVLFLAVIPKDFIDTENSYIDEEKNNYFELPMHLKIKSNNGLMYALELIEIMMDNNDIKFNASPNINYIMPNQTIEELITNDLIKVS